MKIAIKSIKDYLKEALIGALLWIGFLTPYVVFIVGTTPIQYLYWLLMEFVLVLPLAPIVYRITKFFMRGK